MGKLVLLHLSVKYFVTNFQSLRLSILVGFSLQLRFRFGSVGLLDQTFIVGKVGMFDL